ncbi:Hypothetical protein CINCED_3A014007 [Cinara cedri]|uniref:Uncharacterized protein n=1 Tax=Cinara cedri TaxID=506608 RepID=A0A5E4M437_9HEMI|nr:Hypothetical protein CINCED_3A014007 [Cinara cedri]
MQLQKQQHYGSHGPARPIATPSSPRRPKKAVHGGGGGGGCGCAGNRDRWLRTFRAIVDMTCANNKGRDNCACAPKPPVKSILRQPTTYRYIVGMSGFPSKVAVYPDRRTVLLDLRRWVSRRPKDLTFHVTQALTGYGCFRHYLCRMGRAPDAECLHCRHPEDTVEHTLFVCPHWELYRLDVRAYVGGNKT